ncbi:MAG: efflux RND transporter periplasmic adaptor subunit [Tepidisphaeraceae bacterium]
MRRIVVIVVVALLLLAALIASQLWPRAATVSGFIEADEIRVGSRVGGRVQRVAVTEGQKVHAGDLLIELEPFDLLQRHAEAVAKVAQANAQLKLAQVTYDRIKPSFERNVASSDELNKAEADVDVAKATVVAAEAAVKSLDARIAELKVVAPLEGTIEAVDLQPGDLLAPDAPALSISDTSHLWVRAYLPENRLGVKIGDKLNVVVDSFPGRKFAGHLSFVARQAEFTPGNVQTPEERSKQVFRIKVTLDEGLDVLRPGMSADLAVEDAHEPTTR